MEEKKTHPIRILALDTESTGLSHEDGDRIIEIGIVEIDNFKITDREYHIYLNAEGRPVSKEAESIHGISDEFLEDKQKFRDIAHEFLNFIGDSYLLIHNAEFDIGFINAEFARAGMAPFPRDRVIDNIALARQRFPGAAANLDALCRRLKIDNSSRDKHGALLDAQLLAQVYIAMEGVVQKSLDFGSGGSDAVEYVPEGILANGRKNILRIMPTDNEIQQHQNWVSGNVKNHLWQF